MKHFFNDFFDYLKNLFDFDFGLYFILIFPYIFILVVGLIICYFF